MSASHSPIAEQPAAARWRSLLVPGIAALIALAILVTLGTWQLSRLTWKTGLIAQVEERSKAAPVPMPGRAAWAAMTPERDEYRRVTVTGRFRHDAEAYLFHVAGDSRQADRNRPSGQGYFVLTPLMLADGTTVVSTAASCRRSAVIPPHGGKARFRGRDGHRPHPLPRGAQHLRGGGRHGAPDLLHARPRCHRRAQGLDLASTAPFSIDADATPVAGGWPVGGETRLSFSNRHLEYAVTWYGLALTLVGVFGVFARQRLKGR